MRSTSFVVVVAALTLIAAPAPALAGPARPNANLEVILRPVVGGPDSGFGLVKFRQPKDADKIVYLQVRVRDLAPSHGYYLQRATDSIVDDDCTGTNWLTLGQGPIPQAIMTNDRGTGREFLFRDLAAAPTGTQFDIHFQVIDAVTGVPVLASGCYQFTVTQ